MCGRPRHGALWRENVHIRTPLDCQWSQATKLGSAGAKVIVMDSRAKLQKQNTQLSAVVDEPAQRAHTEVTLGGIKWPQSSHSSVKQSTNKIYYQDKMYEKHGTYKSVGGGLIKVVHIAHHKKLQKNFLA